MARLGHLTVEQLHDALEQVDGRRPVQRILAAVAYKDGVTQATIAERHGVSRKTVYSWLQRFAAGSLDGSTVAEAATDADRPGRPRRLSGDQRDRLERRLQEPPTEAGLDGPTWTPALLQEHLREAFDVEYSRPSCRRLLREAGLSYRPRREGDDTHERPGAADGRRGGWVPS